MAVMAAAVVAVMAAVVVAVAVGRDENGYDLILGVGGADYHE